MKLSHAAYRLFFAVHLATLILGRLDLASDLIGVMGGILVFGTFRRWPMIVDPRADRWYQRLFFNSSHRTKRDYGERGVVFLSYAIGGGMIAVGLFSPLRK